MTDTNRSRLLRLAKRLGERIPEGENIKYAVPKIWNTFGYNGKEVKFSSNGTIRVNPYRFYFECINKAILSSYDENMDYSISLSSIMGVENKKEGYLGGDWIAQSSIYGLQIRTSTSWDHDESGELELINGYGMRDTGTFMKTIALIPMLKKIGINVIYMLPVSKSSMKFRKGEMGSPYAVKNFFELDPSLKDPMLGEDFSIDDEFGAFVEACHIMGMRVIIDIIPRTSARDSDLILDHPDWFYWIKIEEAEHYAPPRVGEISSISKPTNENLSIIYDSLEVKKHLERFCQSPDKLNPEKWNDIRRRCKEDKSLDFFNLIQEEMGITTAPAFSDCINDPQPPWSDVTFLKLYMDYPVESQRYVEEGQAPYILFDIIKANKFQGRVINEELWNLIADIIPNYQRRFGIDGARIDMGHALPGDLEKMILNRPREIDRDFCFIAEVLENDGAEKAKESGYNMIIGNLWWSEPRISEGEFHNTLKQMVDLKVPIFACAETPDSPRAASRKGGIRLSRLAAVLNNFLPNGVPFISSGFEIYEIQPMNIGLDATSESRFVLSPDDPLYGKLAFFDRYALHWIGENKDEMLNILEKVTAVRKRFLNAITDKNRYIPVAFKDKWGIGTAFDIKGEENEGGSIILVIANTDFDNNHTITVDLLPFNERGIKVGERIEILYSHRNLNAAEAFSLNRDGDLIAEFEPGEIMILKM